MTIRKRLLIAFAGWILLGLAVFVYEGPYARGAALFTVWSLYAFGAGIWVLMPLLKIVDAAMGREKARGSSNSDEG